MESRQELSNILTSMINGHAAAEEVMKMAEYSAAAIDLGKLRQKNDIDKLTILYAGPKEDRRNAYYEAIVVVATTTPDGIEYGEALGLSNYRVVTSVAQAQGLRMKAYVITPGYLEQMEKAKWEASEVMETVKHSAMSTNAPRG